MSKNEAIKNLVLAITELVTVVENETNVLVKEQKPVTDTVPDIFKFPPLEDCI